MIVILIKVKNSLPILNREKISRGIVSTNNKYLLIKSFVGIINIIIT